MYGLLMRLTSHTSVMANGIGYSIHYKKLKKEHPLYTGTKLLLDKIVRGSAERGCTYAHGQSVKYKDRG